MDRKSFAKPASEHDELGLGGLTRHQSIRKVRHQGRTEGKTRLTTDGGRPSLHYTKNTTTLLRDAPAPSHRSRPPSDKIALKKPALKHEFKHEKHEKHEQHHKHKKGQAAATRSPGTFFEGDFVLEAKKKLKCQLRVLSDGVIAVPEKKKHPNEVWPLLDLYASLKAGKLVLHTIHGEGVLAGPSAAAALQAIQQGQGQRSEYVRLVNPRALRVEGLPLADSSRLQGMMASSLDVLPVGQVFLTDFGLRVLKRSQTEAEVELEIGTDNTNMKGWVDYAFDALVDSKEGNLKQEPCQCVLGETVLSYTYQRKGQPVVGRILKATTFSPVQMDSSSLKFDSETDSRTVESHSPEGRTISAQSAADFGQAVAVRN